MFCFLSAPADNPPCSSSESVALVEPWTRPGQTKPGLSTLGQTALGRLGHISQTTRVLSNRNLRKQSFNLGLHTHTHFPRLYSTHPLNAATKLWCWPWCPTVFTCRHSSSAPTPLIGLFDQKKADSEFSPCLAVESKFAIWLHPECTCLHNHTSRAAQAAVRASGITTSQPHLLCFSGIIDLQGRSRTWTSREILLDSNQA